MRGGDRRSGQLAQGGQARRTLRLGQGTQTKKILQTIFVGSQCPLWLAPTCGVPATLGKRTKRVPLATGTDLEIIPPASRVIAGADAERRPSVHTNAQTDLELLAVWIKSHADGSPLADHPITAWVFARESANAITRRKAATCTTWVASRLIPRPVAWASTRPAGELLKAAPLSKATAPSTVSTELLWKNGPVSAASARGGVLKVPSPGKPIEGHCPLDGLHRVVVEERPDICGLGQGRRVEGAVAREAEAVVGRHSLAGQSRRLIG
jgi:hypothetical protein